MRLARGTPKEVRTTRRPSWAMLLLYQTSRRTEGADVPLWRLLMELVRHTGLGVLRRTKAKGRMLGEMHVPRHHEGGEIRYMQLGLHVDTHVDNHA